LHHRLVNAIALGITFPDVETTQPVRRRVGGRSARVRAAVHDAVNQLMAENGPGPVSIAEVANRSGVHPTSIYRRWGTPEALVLDVAVARLQADLPMPDTGSLRGDLLAYATQAAQDLSRPEGLGFLQAVLIARTSGGADLRAFLQSRSRQIQDMLDRARQRGEPELLATDVIDGVLGPIYMRTLFGIGGLDPAYLAALADKTITAPSGQHRHPPRQRHRQPGKRAQSEQSPFRLSQPP
jgi:AcrR family transcriptional regulator